MDLEKDVFHCLDKDNNVISCSLFGWAQLYEGREGAVLRHVNSTTIEGYFISTVFLGIDHGPPGTPLFFETMIFDENDKDIYTELYATWRQAEEGHKKAIEWIRSRWKNEVK